jgi:hypothetical protein
VEKDREMTGIANATTRKMAKPRKPPLSRASRAPKPGSQSLDGIGTAGSKSGDILPEPDPAIDEIVKIWRRRQRWHGAEKKLVLQGRAVCREWTNGDRTAANVLFDKARAGEDSGDDLVFVLAPFLASIEHFAKRRADLERDLHKRVKSLPVWPWVQSVKGFGPGNLAAIIGEAGDIGSYRSVSGLWKRMGLAVIDGKRQRKCTDTIEALLHGYSPRRRSVAYLLSDTMIRAKSPGYYQHYSDRRAYELARSDAGKPAITPTAPTMHAHRRAARVMTKRVLRDLFLKWKNIEIRDDQIEAETQYRGVVTIEASARLPLQPKSPDAGASPFPLKPTRETQP